MIGQPSMEAAVLGGYARRVLALHPEAPIPGVYKAEDLFRDARALRGTTGDIAFFEKLNQGAPASGGWGELEGQWDAASFERALSAPPDSDERGGLVGALVDSFFRSYRDVARGGQEAYVSMDDGLSIISRHARNLGYDGLVLFLDPAIPVAVRSKVYQVVSKANLSPQPTLEFRTRAEARDAFGKLSRHEKTRLQILPLNR
jgi:hypothetical protein